MQDTGDLGGKRFETVERGVPSRREIPAARLAIDILDRVILPNEAVPDPSLALVARNRQLVRDLTDLAIALASIRAKMDYLVSEDTDLTARDETTAKLRRRLKALLSGTFLREVMGWTSEQLEQVRGRTQCDLEAAEESSE